MLGVGEGEDSCAWLDAELDGLGGEGPGRPVVGVAEAEEELGGDVRGGREPADALLAELDRQLVEVALEGQALNRPDHLGGDFEDDRDGGGGAARVADRGLGDLHEDVDEVVLGAALGGSAGELGAGGDDKDAAAGEAGEGDGADGGAEEAQLLEDVEGGDDGAVGGGVLLGVRVPYPDGHRGVVGGRLLVVGRLDDDLLAVDLRFEGCALRADLGDGQDVPGGAPILARLDDRVALASDGEVAAVLPQELRLSVGAAA